MGKCKKSFYCGFTFLVLIWETCSAFDTYFPLSMVQMALPVSKDSLNILRQSPITSFSAESLIKYGYSSYKYEMDYSDDYLKIDGKTGDVWITGDLNKMENTTIFIISAKDISGNLLGARMTLQIEPIKNITIKQFCDDMKLKICFWESVLYTMAEEEVIDDKEIGDIGPTSYQLLCPELDVTYKLLNATEYLKIKKNKIFTTIPYDHDKIQPGPNFKAHVQCQVRYKKVNQNFLEFNKILQITVLDRNDNPPIVQNDVNKVMVIDLDDPHFIKNKTIGNIIFRDDDAIATNSRIYYEILNDTLEVFHPHCMEYEADHLGLKTSVFNCKLIFARDGILRRSPYCIILKATDPTVDGTTTDSANKTICIKTDLSKIHDSENPKAMRLESPPENMKAKTLTFEQKLAKTYNWDKVEDTSTSDDGSKHTKKLNITFPAEVTVFRTAQNFSRVTQPINGTDFYGKNSPKFKITVDPLDAFGITQQGGIVFVKRSESLLASLTAQYYLTVSWPRNTATILLKLADLEYNTSCSDQHNSTKQISCSESSTKKSCFKVCGTGVSGENCEWRGSEITGPLTIKYGTCSPDFQTCPDRTCDPLEQYAQKFGHHICPQDCTTLVTGPATANSNGIGISAASGVCTCDDFGKCSCGAHDDVGVGKVKGGMRKDKAMNSIQATSTLGLLNSNDRVTHKVAFHHFKCGASCLALMVGCPLFICLIALSFLICRRNQSKKTERKLNNERNFRGTDTEANEIPLVSITSECDYKCDMDTKWEFPRTRLSLDATLGEGEFGKVVKGYASDISGIPGITTVAVKMLKTGAKSVELLALLSEFQLLQEVSHPNVIRLLGVCTQGSSPLVILEYAHHGSLRNYLRLSRKLECSGIELPEGVEPVTVKDILSFAWQICKGMAYLTDIKLVHRDLAARNVLLAKGKICKISDFGLTRDVYEDDAYLKRSKDRVPVKWMAPESLADHVYTNRSDVWAFGILAWELITLGASPYPGIPPQNLYHLLKSGYRMERPENCSDEIYTIVKNCWSDDSTSRPSFRLLASQFEKLLGRNAKYLELDQSAVSNPNYCADPGIINSDQLLESPVAGILEEVENLDHLWFPPNTQSPDLEDISLNQIPHTVPQGYDAPRPLIETKTIEQKLKYENDINIPLKIRKNLYENNFVAVVGDGLSSQPNLELRAHHYAEPVKRGKSYVDMSGEMSGIRNNLDSKNDDKKLSKDITFKFSSLLNLNDEVVSVL